MEDKEEGGIIKEGHINNSIVPVSLKKIEIIIEQMKKSICKINLSNGKNGTGFFCKIPYISQSKNIPFLITNNHILSKNYLDKNKNNIVLPPLKRFLKCF